MSDLHKAIGDISSIRMQVARSTEFRGYGPATLALTGVIAIAAGAAQACWLPDPVNRIPVYLALWISTAVISAALIGAQITAVLAQSAQQSQRCQLRARANLQTVQLGFRLPLAASD